MNKYVEEEIELHPFFISTLFGNEWSASDLDKFLPGEKF
jgi:hypothetical protein